MDLLKGLTAGHGDHSIAMAVAALPFKGSTAGTAVVQVPQLTLESYASLRAELAVWPAHSATILPRYYVMNNAALWALNEGWTAYLAASPKARATFDELFAKFTGYLRTRGSSL